jgi:predicted dehydrogenase
MTDRIRVGMIGTSWWADGMHLPSLTSHPQAEVVAIAGRGREAAEAMASKYHIAQVYNDFRQMIDQAGLDAIVISIPDDLHYEVAMVALDAGLHVLCEKPLALNAAQARAMYEKAEAKGVHHMTYFTIRWRPQFRYVKHLVDSGLAGHLFHAQFSQLGDYARSNKYAWRFDGSRANGVLGDLGPHSIDLARWYGGEIVRVSARLGTYFQRASNSDKPLVPTNDAASLVLEFASGAQATLQVSAVAKVSNHTQEINLGLYGDAGSLLMAYDSEGTRIRAVQNGEPDFRTLPVPTEYWAGVDPAKPNDVFQKHSAGGRAFIDAILEGKTTGPTFYDGWKAQQVIDAALESDKTRKWVEVGA